MTNYKLKLVKSAAALALGASVITTAVVAADTTASAKTTYKVSHGKLVDAKTGKAVKGYVVYKSTLYYNGTVKKGYKTVGTGSSMKLYYNGKLAKGYKTAGTGSSIKLFYNGSLTKGYKTAAKGSDDKYYLFYNGTLKKGYKTAGNGERLYKDGRLDSGYEVYGDIDKNPSLYYNGYLKEGYKTANKATLLFYNGKLKEGYKTANNDTVLYKEGRLNEGLVLVNDILFDGSKQNEGLKKFEDKTYFDAKLANGTYKDENGVEKTYKDGVEVNLAVESVSAINAKTLEVKFNQAVNVTADAFSVAKGTVKANVANVTIAEDKKSAKIELTSKLTKGDYTVTVKQADKDALTGKVSVEDEKVAGIKVLSDVAPLATNKETATAALQVTNQYGEDITAANYSNLDLTATGSSVKAASGVTASVDNKGQITINLDSSVAKTDDKVVLTAVDKTTGTVTSKTITLSTSAVASDVEVGTLYNKDGEVLSEDATGEFYLPVTVKDQYGKEITDVAAANAALLVTNTNATVATIADTNPIVSTTIDGKTVLAVKVTKAAAGSTNLVFVVKATGKTAQSTVTVKAGKSIAGISLGSPVNDVVAANEDVKFPLTLTDNEGNEIKTLKQYKAIDSARGLNTLDTGLSIQEIDGALYIVKDASTVTKGTTSILVTSKTGKIASQVVTVKDAAEAATITGISSKLATSFREGSTSPITVSAADLKIEDQYGRVMDASKLGSVAITATAAITGDKAVFTTGTSGNSATITLSGNENVATADSITFAITGKKGSELSKKFTVVKDADLASYSVKAVPTVYVLDDYSLASAAQDSKYTSDEPVVLASSKAGDTVTLDKAKGEYTVTAAPTLNEAFFKDDNGKAVTEKTVNRTVTINATGEKITVPVTYSIAPAKASKVEVFKKGTDVLTSKITETSKLKANYDANALLAAADFTTTDQYGAESALDTADEVTFTKVSGTVTFENNGTENAAVTKATAGSVVKATVTKDGKSATVEITFEDGVEVVVAPK
ncbi:hypothetical protein ACIQ4I_07815 [Rummeliibacillus sp. NPDC094406]|uniref:hypothetical protein n=1 Tax=Rummeliibacillus sp. NPDC094406 TaxID=3364511 RepID=UPI00381674E0